LQDPGNRILVERLAKARGPGHPRLASVLQGPAAQIGQRCVIAQRDPLAQLHDRALAAAAAQRYIVHACAHDGHAPAGLRQLGYIGRRRVSAALEQRHWPDRRTPQLGPPGGAEPGRLDTTPVIEYLEHAPVPSDLDHYLVLAARTSVPQHVSTGFGDGKQQVRDGVLVYAQPVKRVAKYTAHNGNAE